MVLEDTLGQLFRKAEGLRGKVLDRRFQMTCDLNFLATYSGGNQKLVVENTSTENKCLCGCLNCCLELVELSGMDGWMDELQPPPKHSHLCH